MIIYISGVLICVVVLIISSFNGWLDELIDVICEDAQLIEEYDIKKTALGIVLLLITAFSWIGLIVLVKILTSLGDQNIK